MVRNDRSLLATIALNALAMLSLKFIADSYDWLAKISPKRVSWEPQVSERVAPFAEAVVADLRQ
jgi:hypothetical protein